MKKVVKSALMDEMSTNKTSNRFKHLLSALWEVASRRGAFCRLQRVRTSSRRDCDLSVSFQES